MSPAEKAKILDHLDRRIDHIHARMNKLEESVTIDGQPGRWMDLDPKKFVLFNSLGHRAASLGMVREELDRIMQEE